MRALVLVLALAGSGCPRAAGQCAVDGDCDALHQGYRVCDVNAHQCRCVDDRGCGADERCNAFGDCQARAGCNTNDDCGSGLICDVIGGNCLASGLCVLDDQCPFGHICDQLAETCVAGCRDDADCLIGQGCAGAGFGRLGQCGTTCTADNLCKFGQLCNLSTGTCANDTRGPYCLGCSGGVESDDCGTPGNFCLLDTVNGGAYCGVDCAGGQACAYGYECRNVIILPASTLPTCALPEACVNHLCARTQAPCNLDEQCPEGPPGSDCPRADIGNCDVDVTAPCATDADCAPGLCLKQECRVRESASFGVCSCTRDSDCPRDRCLGADNTDPLNPVVGHCELSGHACFEDPECDVISCNAGGCLIGKNCKPANDRTCVDLL